jgi:hypothetical protein
MKHNDLNRREVLGTLGALGLCSTSFAPTALSAAGAPPTVIAKDADLRECTRLQALDLDDPQVVATRKRMPVAKIGKLTFGRLMSGSNLISPNMHARDLDYVGTLATRYNTPQRVFMTLKKCEEYGINSLNAKAHCFRRHGLSRYWDEWGGRMKWIADVITTDIKKFERVLEEHLELGAAAAYVWGGASDIWYHQKKPGNIIKAFELIKKHGVPAGVGAHRLEPIKFCEKEGINPDFYLKTLHHDRYWSAHPKENRRFLEVYEKESDDHDQWHDNLWCADCEETIEFMQDVKAPWIAFKVLAAGAIPPKEGLTYAFEHGADMVCLGMFDFQVKEDALITQKAVAAAKNRKRPWRA